MKAWTLTFAAVVVGGGLLLAQDRPAPNPTGDPMKLPERKPTQGPRDPTLPSQRLLDSMRPAPTRAPSPAGVEKLPTVVLRGRVLSRNRPPAVLLEIDGKIVLAGKDSALPAGAHTVKVKDVTVDVVEIEMTPSNQTLKLR